MLGISEVEKYSTNGRALCVRPLVEHLGCAVAQVKLAIHPQIVGYREHTGYSVGLDIGDVPVAMSSDSAF